ncbi:MAG TPA: hypothetical protein VHK86_02025 [Nitrososphaera sp.]|nr:hypothetical protein [Nitrososphaera sp.]
MRKCTRLKRGANEERSAMHRHDDEEEKAFRNTIEDLKKLEMQADGAVIGRDFREVILRQMELNHALFQRQHKDVVNLQEGIKRFNDSSKRVEKLTLALIGLTGVLAVMTALLIPH